MKIYPIIKQNPIAWSNWTNTYLKEINSQVISLFDYVYYFNPDFYQVELSQEQEGNTYWVNLSEMPFHAYYRVSGMNIKDRVTGKILNPGTLITSYARGEGEIDNSSAQLRNQEKNYTIQPFGWASYYLIQFGNNQMSFSFDRRAEETYGLRYVFVVDVTNQRYYIKKNNIIETLSDIDMQPTSVSFLAHSGDLSTINNWYIVSQDEYGHINSIWNNIDTNPLMHQWFYVADQTKLYENEEIIFDTKRYTSSKVAGTNIAVYTINRKQSSKWPCKDFLWLEAW